jgi:hypothetical protein
MCASGGSEVGINLETDKPTPQVLRDAVRTVLDTDSYRLRASLMAEEFRMTDTRGEILRAISRLSQNAADRPSRANIRGPSGQPHGGCADRDTQA